jgi:hypothetical protein
MVAVQPTLFGEPPLPIPAARHDDPWTSHSAARTVRRSASELNQAIINALVDLGEGTQFQIAFCDCERRRRPARLPGLRRRSSPTPMRSYTPFALFAVMIRRQRTSGY